MVEPMWRRGRGVGESKGAGDSLRRNVCQLGPRMPGVECVPIKDGVSEAGLRGEGERNRIAVAYHLFDFRWLDTLDRPCARSGNASRNSSRDGIYERIILIVTRVIPADDINGVLAVAQAG